MRVLLPPGCAEPRTLVEELVRQAARLRPLTLMGGLLLGDYPFCAPEYAESFRWVTFHMMPALREAAQRGQVDFVPARYFDTLWIFAPGGPWAADAVLIHTAPPDADGRLSLGVSTSYPLPLARRAPLVIAEVNHQMPRTRGDSSLGLDQVAAWTETDRPLVGYPAPAIGDPERRIAARVAELIPDGATIQIGIGSVPEAIVGILGDRRDLAIHSLLVDAMLPLLEGGVITNARKSRNPGRMDLGEIMGTEPLFRFVHENPVVNMEPSSSIHNPQVVARLEGFVSINSAVEVDLTGQVNAESLGDRQVAGIGGQFDFVEGAYWAPGGRSVIALPATGRGGEVSRIVARLGAGAKVTTPRYLTDCVVTEFGRAELRGRSVEQRARALMGLAHPGFREQLEREWRGAR
ncbi:MAG TPA: acetyl-CoA hydrolase/transferase C-terminal domain-containing protein [Methylomirabilota bacterium]|jgi:acyl-CoA hydrolase|nr:acetyl-CoA hydrolase/transferase C-terminal domain-containing protein [Methylomirabilota bacterium]